MIAGERYENGKRYMRKAKEELDSFRYENSLPSSTIRLPESTKAVIGYCAALDDGMEAVVRN